MIYTVGHRGAAGIQPENTLPSFQYAIKLGVTHVECDVHVSYDQTLVVIHDETVDRTTNGTGKVNSMPFSILRQLNAGGGEPIPTLNEVLQLTQGRAILFCELKGAGVEDIAIDLVEARSMAAEVVFTSFSVDRLTRVRRRGDHYLTGLNLQSADERGLRIALDVGVSTVGVYYKNLSLAGVELFRNVGIDIRAWNPDTRREIFAAIGLGVNGVSSNRPDRLMKCLEIISNESDHQ